MSAVEGAVAVASLTAGNRRRCPRLFVSTTATVFPGLTFVMVLRGPSTTAAAYERRARALVLGNIVDDK